MPGKVHPFTDGNDTARKAAAQGSRDRQEQGDCHPRIGIGDPSATGEDKLDTATLKKIATDTGGQYFSEPIRP